jgi:hypothetical protein
MSDAPVSRTITIFTARAPNAFVKSGPARSTVARAQAEGSEGGVEQENSFGLYQLTR